MFINHIKVNGRVLDEQTRCDHYHSEKDIIAIKFKCCHTYYPCYQCHQEANHEIEKWPRHLFHEKAILCGSCHIELTIHDYLNFSTQCPNCHASFNPGCQLHHHLYFEL